MDFYIFLQNYLPSTCFLKNTPGMLGRKMNGFVFGSVPWKLPAPARTGELAWVCCDNSIRHTFASMERSGVPEGLLSSVNFSLSLLSILCLFKDLGVSVWGWDPAITLKMGSHVQETEPEQRSSCLSRRGLCLELGCSSWGSSLMSACCMLGCWLTLWWRCPALHWGSWGSGSCRGCKWKSRLMPRSPQV